MEHSLPPKQRQQQDEFARRQNLLEEVLLGLPTPPLPGDLLNFADSRYRWLCWLVITERHDAQRYLVVPADTSPQAGSADLVVSHRALCGPLVLRLGLRRWWPRPLLAQSRRVGILEEWHRHRAHGVLMQYLKGTLRVMPWQRETDLDPIYQRWLNTLEDTAIDLELKWDRGPS